MIGATRGPEHRRVEDDRRDEDAEGEKHLHDVLHVAEEQVGAAEEERRGECETIQSSASSTGTQSSCQRGAHAEEREQRR